MSPFTRTNMQLACQSVQYFESFETTSFQRNKKGFWFFPNEGPRHVNTAETLSCLRFSDNQYVANNQDVEVRFQSIVPPNLIYANDATLLVEDFDFVFPNPEDVDLGPAENGNEYQVFP